MRGMCWPRLLREGALEPPAGPLWCCSSRNQVADSTHRMKITLRLAALATLLLACGPKPPVPVITRPDGTIVEAPPEPKEEEERAADAISQEAAQLRQK